MHAAPIRFPRKPQPWAAAVLVLGLLAAVALDGQLPGHWFKALLGVLLVLDVIVAEWLTRPR